MGEVLQRVVACALCIPFRSPKAELFEPLQYGVNTFGGCEMIVHAVNAHLQSARTTSFCPLTAGVLLTAREE